MAAIEIPRLLTGFLFISCILSSVHCQITCIQSGGEQTDPCAEGRDGCKLGLRGELIDDPCVTVETDCGPALAGDDGQIKCSPVVGCCCKGDRCNDPKATAESKELCKLPAFSKTAGCSPPTTVKTSPSTTPPPRNTTPLVKINVPNINPRSAPAKNGTGSRVAGKTAVMAGSLGLLLAIPPNFFSSLFF